MAEEGEEGVAGTVHVSAGEAMAHANPPRSNKEQILKESLRGIMHKDPLLQRGYFLIGTTLRVTTASSLCES